MSPNQKAWLEATSVAIQSRDSMQQGIAVLSICPLFSLSPPHVSYLSFPLLLFFLIQLPMRCSRRDSNMHAYYFGSGREGCFGVASGRWQG